MTRAADVVLSISDSGWAEREGLVAFAGYPLLLDSRLVGVLAMFAPRHFQPSALDAMAAVADAVALGIGFVVSALLSYGLSRQLGLLDAGPNHA